MNIARALNAGRNGVIRALGTEYIVRLRLYTSAYDVTTGRPTSASIDWEVALRCVVSSAGGHALVDAGGMGSFEQADYLVTTADAAYHDNATKSEQMVLMINSEEYAIIKDDPDESNQGHRLYVRRQS